MPYEISTPQDNYILSESATILYGDSGIGKTTICRNLPNPLYLIMRGGGEHRPLALVGTKIPFIEILTKQHLDEVLLDLRREQKLRNGYKPEFLVVDQLPSMYTIYLRNIMQTVSRKRDTPDTPSPGDYGQGHRQFGNWLIEINQIPNIHKVYLALAEIDEDEATKERYGAPQVPGKLSKDILKYMDFVFRMYNKRTVVNNKLVEGRVFQTNTEGIWIAKDSTGRLPKPSFEIPDADFDFWNKVVLPCLQK